MNQEPINQTNTQTPQPQANACINQQTTHMLAQNKQPTTYQSINQQLSHNKHGLSYPLPRLTPTDKPTKIPNKKMPIYQSNNQQTNHPTDNQQPTTNHQHASPN